MKELKKINMYIMFIITIFNEITILQFGKFNSHNIVLT